MVLPSPHLVFALHADVITGQPGNNVTDHIFKRLGANLHTRPGHPLATIKAAIYEYMNSAAPGTYRTFDDLYPIVSAQVPRARGFGGGFFGEPPAAAVQSRARFPSGIAAWSADRRRSKWCAARRGTAAAAGWRRRKQPVAARRQTLTARSQLGLYSFSTWRHPAPWPCVSIQGKICKSPLYLVVLNRPTSTMCWCRRTM